MFITNNDSLIIKTHVIPGISDHDAVFVEGINIKATINKQNSRMVPLCRIADWDALNNTFLNNYVELCHALY